MRWLWIGAIVACAGCGSDADDDGGSTPEPTPEPDPEPFVPPGGARTHGDGGETLCAVRLGTPEWAWSWTRAAAEHVAVGSSSVVVAGDFSTVYPSAPDDGLFVSVFDTSCRHVASRWYLGPKSYLIDVQLDPSGNIVLLGFVDEQLDLGGEPLTNVGDSDVFVAKLDAKGELLWQRQFESSSESDAITLWWPAGALAIDAFGNVVVVGNARGDVDFGAGTSSGYAGDDTGDAFVVKLDPLGSLVYARRFGDAEAQHASAVAIDAAGRAIVGGSFEGVVTTEGAPLSTSTSSTFILALDADGSPVDARVVADPIAMAVTEPSGTVLGAGFAFDFDAPLIFTRYDGSSLHSWTATTGSVYAFSRLSLAVAPAGDAIVTGQIDRPIDFGNGLLSPAPDTVTSFIAKLEASGGPRYARRFGGSAYLADVATSSDGAAFVVGSFAGGVDLDGIAYEGDGSVLVKLSP